MKGSPNLSTAQCLVRIPGTLSRAPRIEGDEGIETGVVSVNMREMCVEHFEGRDPPPADAFGEIVGGREERTRGRGCRLGSSREAGGGECREAKGGYEVSSVHTTTSDTWKAGDVHRLADRHSRSMTGMLQRTARVSRLYAIRTLGADLTACL